MTTITKPIKTSSRPTGSVKSITQINPPVPLPSSHIDPPWKMDVTKARSKGEIAKIRPTRMKGKRLILQLRVATKQHTLKEVWTTGTETKCFFFSSNAEEGISFVPRIQHFNTCVPLDSLNLLHYRIRRTFSSFFLTTLTPF